MRVRSLDHSATRSGAFARRAGIVTLAAALVAVPLAAAAPANAAAAVVTGAGFSEATVTTTGVAQGVFYDSADQFFASGFDACMFEYNDGTPLASNSVTPIATATAPYATGEKLTAAGFVVGDKYTVAYADATDVAGVATCVAPTLDTAGLVQASITLTQAPPEVPPMQLTASDVKFTRGVPVDQYLSYTTDGLDFSQAGGYMGFGPQSANEPEPGYVYPLEGITIDTLDEGVAGVAPRVHFTGTPKYSGTYSTGFFVTDGTNTGVADVKIITTDKSGVVTPISIDLAIGQPVAGAKVALIAAGLQEGAAWSATVRSTPVIVGSGTIAFGGQLATTVTIPAGLEAGTHSITVLSTNADGSQFSAVLYFTVSATGTLLAVSTSAAELAATGQDFAPSLFVAGGLLFAGAAFASITAIRRRRNA